ncbi:hypothetical protein CROQUDRAFT_82469 [Cronartium quercuum f. sp. fusiforme G11]|uniref:Protein kinase domain-containing protein n=1 Tax=Cronartium quercuum f. sp. fusiforme G11 TaxID=708437 RepID=A0A9P6T7K3_9BASI|nr:hypothetical protein CROQUDRAFT_82469 [Cronartium quercuum f. sp. fusiforme G11]
MEYLKAAASYLDRSNISTSYTNLANPINNLSNNTPSTSTSTSNYVQPTRIGLWNVQRATHNTSNKLVSIWTFEKKLEIGIISSSFYNNGRSNCQQTPLEKAIEVLKKEASSLSRLRHPCILEVVEPLEETRTMLIFATEPVTACLTEAISQSNSRSSSKSYRNPSSLELDEVETQKGLLQIGKGLQFLHESVHLVHSNLTPEAIIINSKGDWKISGFGLSIYLNQTNTKWEFPIYDPNLPDSIQKNFDYISPEYILDEKLSTSNDLYSLGCILHFIQTKSGPPFYNKGDINLMRKNIENLEVLSTAWSKVSDDVKEVLSQLITRNPNNRLTSKTFLNSNYFNNNLLVSTLAFLDRDTFNSKQNEEQIQFLKGLIKLLPKFSNKIILNKILPFLLEEIRKTILIPFLLPNIFYIAKQMNIESFRQELLPHLIPLFKIKEPPQIILTLIDHLTILKEKSTPEIFRENIMELIYFALESDLPVLQEKSLRVIPSLCESLEYTHVKQVLFPKVTMIFSKTTLLSIKVNTLICFHSMVKILDKYTLTERLVPILARIKTKEPAVMIATLAVHEEMGKKVEINSIAKLILPQLWNMSIGPLLNLEQFNRFMKSIEILSKRVKDEHSKELLEIKRLNDNNHQSNDDINQLNVGNSNALDFESLVKGSTSTVQKVHNNHSNNLLRLNQLDQVEYDGFGSPSNTSPTFSAWGLDDSIKINGPSAFSNNHQPLSNRNSNQSSFSREPSINEHSHVNQFNDGLPPFGTPFPPPPPLSNNNTLNNSMMMNQILKPHPQSRSTIKNTLTNQSTFNLTSTSNNNNNHTFIGLPTLQPQQSSLSEFIQQSKTVPSLNWNVIPPNHQPNSTVSFNSSQKSLNKKVELSDFDPFA